MVWLLPGVKFLEKVSIEMQCDLLMAGLVPGVDKCVWDPTEVVNWQRWADANVFASLTRKQFDDAKREDAPPLITIRSQKTRWVTDAKFRVTGVSDIS